MLDKHSMDTKSVVICPNPHHLHLSDFCHSFKLKSDPMPECVVVFNPTLQYQIFNLLHFYTDCDLKSKDGTGGEHFH